jgi:hypothetical protein
MKRSWPNFKVLSRYLPGGLRKTTKNLTQDSRSPGRDLNPRPPEFEARLLTTRPRYSVYKRCLDNRQNELTLIVLV